MISGLKQRYFDAFAGWVIRRALRTPYRHLRHADGRPYMDRYWLFRIGGGEYPWFGARVHHILSSDNDLAMHDHPWPFVSIILRGGYREVRLACDFPRERNWYTNVGDRATLVTSHDYTAGAVLFRRASTWHLLHLAPGQEAVTLFITLPKLQSWGFLWRSRKVDWREFDRLTGREGIRSAHEPGGNLVAYRGRANG